MARKEKNYYFDAFERGLFYTNEAAELLEVCFEDFDADKLQPQLVKMQEIEHGGDQVKHEMMEKLMKEFLPPLDREDIVELARIIDNVTDSIEDVLQGMHIYNVRALRPEVKQFVNLISRCCKAMIEAAKEMHNFRKSVTLREKIVEINTLEEEGDRLFRTAMRELYVNETNPITVLVWTTMYKRLERCCDCCEDVADMIEQIVMKNS